MSLINTPYPKPKLQTYVLVAAIVGLVVNFILIVFQPFGTADFDHENKTLILAGYGLAVAISLILYYVVTTKLINTDNWSITNEVIELFVGILISLIACYIYSILIFNRSFSLGSLLYFIGIAGSVAIIPVSAYLVLLYTTWKGFERSELDSDNDNGTKLTIIGKNKTDKIKVQSRDIMMAKAQDNYVLIYLNNDGAIKKHILRATLKEVYNQLDSASFKKVHRSYLVNTNLIEKVSGNKSKAHLNISGISKNIPVSRSAYDDIKTLVNN